MLALACVGLLGLATPALAHNSLTGSNPPDKASLDAGPGTVELTFDQPVQAGAGLNTVAITGPNNTRWEAGPPEVDSNVVTTPVRELGPKGSYTIGYRIVSADGHPVKGDLTFTLTTAGNGTPAPANAEPAGSDGGSAGGGLPIWVWIVGAVVLLGGGITVALRIGGKQPQ